MNFCRILLAVIFIFSVSAVCIGTTFDIEGTRTAVEKWVETQAVISKEKQDWAVAKELLSERIELVQREIESISGKISQAEASIAEADKKRVEQLEENENLKKSAESLGGTLNQLESRVKKLLKKLPEPIAERIKPISQRLPQDVNNTKLSLSERFQNVVGILNEIDKFNREVTAASEVRTLKDGSTIEVTAVYVGIAYGCYASADGKTAGIAVITENGWQWKETNEYAPQILAAVSILKNEKVASFVQLPIKIQ